MRAGRVWLGLAVSGLICLPGAVALAAAASGFSVHVKAPGSVGRQQAFTITASGSAKRKAGLILFLAQKPCKSSYVLEYNAIGARKPEQPYFQRGKRIASRSNVSRTYKVNGSFKFSVTAHTGKHAIKQYVCAYMPTGKPKVTRAHASTTYSMK